MRLKVYLREDVKKKLKLNTTPNLVALEVGDQDFQMILLEFAVILTCARAPCAAFLAMIVGTR